LAARRDVVAAAQFVSRFGRDPPPQTPHFVSFEGGQQRRLLGHAGAFCTSGTCGQGGQLAFYNRGSSTLGIDELRVRRV